MDENVNKLLADNGFTIAGGIWGANAWKRISPTRVAAIGQGEDADDEFLDAPTAMLGCFRTSIFEGDIRAWWNEKVGEAPFYDSRQVMATSLTDAILVANSFD